MLTYAQHAFSGEEHQPFHWEGGSCAALLVHGFPGTPAEMRPIAELLHKMGWTVRAVLLPGFGSDIKNLPNRSHQDWLDSVSADLSDLRQRYDKVILIGYSMGGALSITLATQDPIDGLVLFSPFIKVNHLLWGALPVIRLFLPKVKIFKLFKPDFSDLQTRQGISDFMPKADLDDPAVQRDILEFELPISMFHEIRMLGQKARKCAAQLSMPVQVFQGIEDRLVMPATTATLIQNIETIVDYSEVHAPHEIIDVDLPAWSKIEVKLSTFIQQIANEGA